MTIWTPPDDHEYTEGEELSAETLETFVADNLTHLKEELGEWQDYTPTVLNSGHAAVSKTVTVARYKEISGLVYVYVRLDITSNSAASGNITVSLPIPAVAGRYLVGGFAHQDASSGFTYNFGSAFTHPDGLGIYGIPHQAPGGAGFGTQLGTGDAIYANATYEAAS